MGNPVRIGILGAATIVPGALLKPAREVPDVQVVAIAARDRHRAAAFARKHKIPQVHDSYEALLADPHIDAVYLPLPNSLHCQWSIHALEAGKHVLCEKPLAANATEAEQMLTASRRTGRLLVEAMHYRYHPLAAHLRKIIDSGVLGTIRHIEAYACVPIISRKNIRWRYDLGGGAMMDLGCYAVNVVRLAAAAEPAVVRAKALLSTPDVDRWLEADLEFADGRTGRVTCSMWSSDFLRGEVFVKGDQGTLKIGNPTVPHLIHDIVLKTSGRKTRDRLRGLKTTYYYQLAAFVAAVRSGVPPITDAADALANQRVVDAAYRAAGLPPRGMPFGANTIATH